MRTVSRRERQRERAGVRLLRPLDRTALMTLFSSIPVHLGALLRIAKSLRVEMCDIGFQEIPRYYKSQSNGTLV